MNGYNSLAAFFFLCNEIALFFSSFFLLSFSSLSLLSFLFFFSVFFFFFSVFFFLFSFFEMRDTLDRRPATLHYSLSIGFCAADPSTQVFVYVRAGSHYLSEVIDRSRFACR